MAYPIVILGSGRGSNAEAILKARAARSLGSATIAAIISDREDAPILDLGNKHEVPAIHLDPGRKGASFSEAGLDGYIERVGSFSPELIVLAGFMRIVPPRFIEAFEGRVINLHPSLLPSFPGLDAVRQAYEHGVKITGCTVHWVTPELDAGPIIDQKAVRIDEKDTLEMVEKNVHIAEHRLLPDVIARLSKGRIGGPDGE